jgi:hypothetical protein
MKYRFNEEIGEWMAVGNPAEWCPDFKRVAVTVATGAAGPLYRWTCQAQNCPAKVPGEEPGAYRDHYTWTLPAVA